VKSLLHGGILVDKSCGLNEVKKDIIIENGIITSIVDPIDLNFVQNSDYEKNTTVFNDCPNVNGWGDPYKCLHHYCRWQKCQ